ncbi:MAG TPA: phosphoribosyltransferase family protein [Kofleriaceae bacterium]|nr:phosphoribosyltransferase family protein [Kofleriaceae bacterium]
MLEWLFRPECAACGAMFSESEAAAGAPPLCGACAGSLLELGPACPRCAEPTGARDAREVVCGRCRAAPLPLERIAVPWRFGGQLAAAIRRLKFAGRAHVARDLAPLWAPLLAAAAAAAAAADGADGAGGERGGVVVPVPLHWRRRLARGYDQTWLLARHACAAAGLPPPVPALRRARAAPPQSTLPAAARQANLRGAFAVRRPDAIAGRAVILVDDVVTTGATLAAAAAALHAAGAACVIGVALARATSAPG